MPITLNCFIVFYVQLNWGGQKFGEIRPTFQNGGGGVPRAKNSRIFPFSLTESVPRDGF